MAHLKSIVIPKCEAIDCEKAATRELYNHFNKLVGRYCNYHVGRKYKEVDDAEKYQSSRLVIGAKP